MKRGTRNDPRNIGQNGDDELYRCLNSLDNKAEYMAALVADGWAGAENLKK